MNLDIVTRYTHPRTPTEREDPAQSSPRRLQTSLWTDERQGKQQDAAAVGIIPAALCHHGQADGHGVGVGRRRLLLRAEEEVLQAEAGGGGGRQAAVAAAAPQEAVLPQPETGDQDEAAAPRRRRSRRQG